MEDKRRSRVAGAADDLLGSNRGQRDSRGLRRVRLIFGPLAKKLREGADAHGVSEYLSEIQSERMEIPATPDQLTDVGERVAGWYAVEMEG